MRGAENDDGNPRRQQQAVPADRGCFALQAGHEVGDGDIDEAGGGDDDDVGDRAARVVEREITADAAGDGGEAGDAVPEQRATALPAGGEQDREVAGFLRHFMGDDGQCGAPAKYRADEEGGGDQKAVGEVVKSVADQDQEGFAALAMHMVMAVGVIGTLLVVLERVEVARAMVGVAPQRRLFQREEAEDAGEQ